MDTNSMYEGYDFEELHEAETVKRTFYTEKVKRVQKPCTLAKRFYKWIIRMLP